MIANLQVLRGLAALLVVFHHSLTHFYIMGLDWPVFEVIARYGFMGVDVFFVISGVVMAISTEKIQPGQRSGLNFMKKRFLRIFMGYWPMLILAFGVVFMYSPERFNEINWLGSVLLISTRMNELLITPSWSLTYELLFYLLVGLTVLWQLKYHLFLLLAVLVFIKVNSMPFGESQFLDIVLSPFIFEFLFGYYLWKLRKPLLQRKFTLGVILILILGLICGVYFATENSTWRVFTFGLFAFAVVWLAISTEKKQLGRFYLYWMEIGNASYTLYLIHTIALLAFVGSGLRQWLVAHNLAMIGFWLMLGVVVLFSWGVYKVIEKPLYQWSVKVKNHHT